jgi:L-serine dehydratase
VFVSTLDLFKLGLGPSSSHTTGPMVAAGRFLGLLHGHAPARIRVTLHGSLSLTGRGHHTDRAVCLGLMGAEPATIEPDAAEAMLEELRRTRRLDPPGLGRIAFDPEADLVFDPGRPRASHPNALTFEALDAAGAVLVAQVYCSVGGGFVLTEAELSEEEAPPSGYAARPVPYPFRSAAEMLEMAAGSGLSIAEMKRANELARGINDLDDRLDAIVAAMEACIDRGLATDGTLPGGLRVRRRAAGIAAALAQGRPTPHAANEWLSVWAMAVNEENAAGGRVVTAPTNGAAGTLPAVLRYWREMCGGGGAQATRDFLLTAAAVGGIIKANASISGAEVGCQGEVGSAAAMAAAGLAAVLGGTPEQIENAAEIALEHHLGMTCDPAGGLVQVPCIERNALGAIKAVSAAALALRGDGRHVMPLDNCIRAMLETGRDMSDRYKETSRGGIAVNLPEC